MDDERTKYLCKNWGCGVVYTSGENGNNVCKFHPGVWQFGSYHVYKFINILGLLARSLDLL